MSPSRRLLAMLSLLFSAPIAAAPAQAVGISVGSLDNPFFKALIRGAVAEIRAGNPQTKIYSVGSDFQLEKQQQQIDRFIAERVDMILLVAAHPQQIAPAVRRAQMAGIRVIAVDVEAEGADITVQSDNLQAGRMVCDHLARHIGGKGNFVIQNGPSVSSIRDRVHGCRQALKNHPDIRLLSDSENGKASSYGGMMLMRTHLANYRRIDAVFAINDRQAIGADLAARKAGRNTIAIGSVDGSPDIEASLRQDSLIQASASQDPFILGQMAARLGQQLLDGRAPATNQVRLPVQLLTRDNVDQYKGWTAKR